MLINEKTEKLNINPKKIMIKH